MVLIFRKCNESKDNKQVEPFPGRPGKLPMERRKWPYTRWVLHGWYHTHCSEMMLSLSSAWQPLSTCLPYTLNGQTTCQLCNVQQAPWDGEKDFRPNLGPPLQACSLCSLVRIVSAWLSGLIVYRPLQWCDNWIQVILKLYLQAIQVSGSLSVT